MKIDPSLVTAVSAAAETLVNRVLQLDPSAQAKINELEGVVIKLTITPFGLPITVQACDTRLIISGNDEKFTNADIHAFIEGSPFALSRLLHDENLSALTPSSNIKLQGDKKKAEQFQAVLSKLDLDWESALADIIGDIPAHFIGQRFRNSRQWGKQSQDSLMTNIEEHLHEESKLLPNRYELEEQFEKITELSLSAIKLKERLEKLASLPNK